MLGQLFQRFSRWMSRRRYPKCPRCGRELVTPERVADELCGVCKWDDIVGEMNDLPR